MPPKRQRRPAPDLETNIPPASDAIPADDRRNDQAEAPPDSLPPRGDTRIGEEPAGGGFTPRPDGGNEQHPIHDEDQEDADASDYEHEIDRLDAATHRS